MSPAHLGRWSEIRRIFEGLEGLSPDAASAWLDRECGVDRALRAAVQRLTEAARAVDRDPSHGLDVAGGDAYALLLLDGADAEPPATAPDDPRLGTRIGNYRILVRLGEGGMGVVYEAEQENPRRLVALKLIRGGQGLVAAHARLFEREIETLGRLRHPGIAVIHEAGRTEDGLAFFAMERVHGLPLDQHLRGGGPRVPGQPSVPPATERREQHARLGLFLEICDAIQYAHQRGVIHRDLKPANLFVTQPLESPAGTSGSASSGRASRGDSPIKVLDFGLARITDPDATRTTLEGDARRIQGTLAYMSPEQARGLPDEIDIRSDLYSLGVVLYELMTGALPVETRDRSTAEALRRIEEMAPVRPASRVPALRGDLETVLLKSLAKSPSDRYQSVEALADDVRRVLQNVPVLARRPSLARQLGSLVRRHPLASALAGALVVALVAFSGTMAVLYARARAAERAAVRETARAERVSAFMVELFRAPDPGVALGDTLTARDLLDRGARRIDAELSADPTLRRQLLMTIGQSFYGLGLYDRALPLVARALEIAERDDPRGIATGTALAQTARVQLARGELAAADSLIAQSRAVLDAGDATAIRERTESVSLQGALRTEQGRFAEAESLHILALSTRRRALGPLDGATLHAFHNLGSTFLGRGRFEEAADTLRQVLLLRTRALGEHHPEVFQTLNELAEAERRLAHYAVAESLFLRAIAGADRIQGPDHPEAAYLWNNLGLTYFRMKRLPEAERAMRRALSIREARLPASHPMIAWTLDNLGLIQIQLGRLDAAERSQDRALAIAAQAVGTRHIDYAILQNNRALLLEKQGRLRTARDMRRATIPIYVEAYGPESPGLARTLEDLSNTEAQLGEIESAIEHRERQLAMVEKRRGPDHEDTRRAREALARLRSLRRR